MVNSNQMEPIVFFIVPSNLYLTFQKTYYIIWTWKSTPKIFWKIMLVFKRLGINFVMKTNSIDQKQIIRMFTTSILRVRTEKQLFVRKIHIFSNIWILLVICPPKKDPIHCFASTFKKHKDINSTLQMNASNSFKRMYPKNWYYFQKFIYFLYVLFGDPNFL